MPIGRLTADTEIVQPAALRFAASYDRGTKAISAASCVVLLVLTALIYNTVIGALALLVIGLSYAFSPRGYIVSQDFIVIRRLIGLFMCPLRTRSTPPRSADHSWEVFEARQSDLARRDWPEHGSHEFGASEPRRR